MTTSQAYNDALSARGNRLWQGRQILWLLLLIALGVALALLPLMWAAALVAVTAVVLLTVIQPLFGLFLTLLLAPLGALESSLYGASLLDSGQLLLIFTVAAWLGRGLARGRIVIPRTWLNLPLALFLMVASVSLLRALSLPFALVELIKWLEVAVITLIVVDLVQERLETPRLHEWNARHSLMPQLAQPGVAVVVGMLLLAGISQALIGIWQFGLLDDGPEHFLVLGRFYRAFGTFEQPNPFGGFMNLIALLAAGTLLGGATTVWQQWRGRRKEAGREFVPGLLPAQIAFYLLAAAAALLGTMAVLFSWSRGAWLSFAAGTAVMVLFWPRKLWQGVVLLALAALVFGAGIQLGVVPASLTERLTSFSEDLRFGDVRGVDINDDNYAVLERLAHWQAAVDMARDNVWFGVGFGNYEPAYADYALVNWPYPLGHAHNYYLNLLAEVGVLGLMAYVTLWTAVFFQTIRQLRTLAWPPRGIALGLLAAWTAISVHHLVDKLYVNNIYVYLGVMLGLLQLLEFERKRSRVAPNNRAIDSASVDGVDFRPAQDVR